MDQALIELASYIEARCDEPLSLAHLAKRIGLSPTHFQKRFKAHFGLSPKKYQDGVRQKRLKSALKDGEGIAGAIFEAGYGSTSRVYGGSKNKLGIGLKSYQKGGAGETINYAICVSSLGHLLMAATPKGVCCVQFGEGRADLIAQLRLEFPLAELIEADHDDNLNHWLNLLDAYLRLETARPNLPLDMRGTVFQLKTWQFLTTLKDDETLSYAQLASAIHVPKAVRAAASACASNRIAILIPCHKVLHKDAGLGGYRWGCERKAALLERDIRGRSVAGLEG